MVDVFNFSQSHPFLKDHEYNDGDVFIFDGDGRWVDDKWGTHRLQMDVILPNQEVRAITVNKTSQKNITAKWGTETNDWVGKSVFARKKDLFIGGQDKKVMILEPRDN